MTRLIHVLLTAVLLREELAAPAVESPGDLIKPTHSEGSKPTGKGTPTTPSLPPFTIPTGKGKSTPTGKGKSSPTGKGKSTPTGKGWPTGKSTSPQFAIPTGKGKGKPTLTLTGKWPGPTGGFGIPPTED
ncbi:uncharacterized protein BCR38DRAFT_482038 [Pseudomassariella vexata]|uniref:Uncharacterized protein n=1 Tax=Pseudomassariella vexata TaxID=1141098 RepID=A0A1Y2EAD9_9PEZI|nr:uncharacterized protein BCR38DRAFT_482038 [Pseudomassariella vexata]ORY68550.1 hypothetical protein BCR38DRAFT_482038 [Pseudomassariella vexata]